MLTLNGAPLRSTVRPPTDLTWSWVTPGMLPDKSNSMLKFGCSTKAPAPPLISRIPIPPPGPPGCMRAPVIVAATGCTANTLPTGPVRNSALLSKLTVGKSVPRTLNMALLRTLNGAAVVTEPLMVCVPAPVISTGMLPEFRSVIVPPKSWVLPLATLINNRGAGCASPKPMLPSPDRPPIVSVAETICGKNASVPPVAMSTTDVFGMRSDCAPILRRPKLIIRVAPV